MHAEPGHQRRELAAPQRRQELGLRGARRRKELGRGERAQNVGREVAEGAVYPADVLEATIVVVGRLAPVASSSRDRARRRGSEASLRGAGCQGSCGLRGPERFVMNGSSVGSGARLGDIGWCARALRPAPAELIIRHSDFRFVWSCFSTRPNQPGHVLEPCPGPRVRRDR